MTKKGVYTRGVNTPARRTPWGVARSTSRALMSRLSPGHNLGLGRHPFLDAGVPRQTQPPASPPLVRESAGRLASSGNATLETVTDTRASRPPWKWARHIMSSTQTS